MGWRAVLVGWWVATQAALAAPAAPIDAFLSQPGERPVLAWPRGAVTATEPRLGVPTFFWAEPEFGRRTPRAMGLDPTQAARRHLLAHAALYRAAPAQGSTATVAHVHDTSEGAVVVSFQQRLDGVRVFRDELKVVMDRQLRLVALSGYLTPEVARLGTFSLDPRAAVAAAWAYETGTLQEPLEPTSPVPDDEGYLEWSAPARWARARPAYFPLAEGVMPAFSIELETPTGGTAWVISAHDGTPLFRKDLVAAHGYLVWADPVTKVPLPGPHGSTAMPHPGGTFDPAFVAASVPQALVTLDHSGLSTGDPWLAPGATDTRGNHVQAYTDVAWPDGYTPGADALGTVTSPGLFEHVPLPGLDVPADAVHVFYVANFLHDWLYDAGFDERAGNAQLDNFQRGGAANDVLRAELRDFSGQDNANMLTPADGRSPRMQLYWWYSVSGWRNGAFDTSLVAHEYGHYVSNRLIGNATGIANHQGYGLGEGWSDFIAQLLLAAEDDLQEPSNDHWQGAYPIASYAMGGWNFGAYFGVRRYPLSTDFSRNPLTYLHIQRDVPLPTTALIKRNASPNQQVHNTGEVWAVMLWECYAALLRDPRYAFSAARERMKRYLVASLKATPLMPTFIEARDALLSVAAASDVGDYLALWNAFARRGIGGGATGPDRFNGDNMYVSESYVVANSVRLISLELQESAGSCDADGVLDADEAGVLLVGVRNLGVQPLTAGQATLTVSANAAGVQYPAGASVPVPALAPFEDRVLPVPVALGHVLGAQGVEFTATVAGPTLFPPTASGALALRLNVDEAPVGRDLDDFEARGSAWVAGADAQLDTTGGFRLLQVTPTQHFWSARPGASSADLWLTSPPLRAGAGPLTVRFLHRYEFERTDQVLHDGAVLELSADDGGTWTDIGELGTPGYVGALSTAQGANPLAGRRAWAGRSAGFPSFMEESVALGTTWANQVVRLRFRLGADDVLRLPSRGWEVDEVRVTGLAEPPFPLVTADPNRCTNTAPVAMVGPALDMAEGERVVLEGTATDAEGDALSLNWAQRTGPLGVLSGNVFVAPEVTADEPLVLELTAHDGRVPSAPAPLTILVRNVNRVPVVTVPGDRRATAGERLTLVGSARDGDGDPLTYAWSQVGGPPVSLDGAATPGVSFEAPALGEEQAIVLALTASDGRDTSAPARVTVTVQAVPLEQEPPPAVSGCGCSSGEPLWALLALAGVARRRRG